MLFRSNLLKVNRTLTRRERIRRRPEFLKVQQAGVRVRGRFQTLFVLPNQHGLSRLGIIATRRLGGAVYRNRSKRLIREMFRLNKGRPGLDLVVLPRFGFFDVPFASLQAYSSATRSADASCFINSAITKTAAWRELISLLG